MDRREKNQWRQIGGREDGVSRGREDRREEGGKTKGGDWHRSGRKECDQHQGSRKEGCMEQRTAEKSEG